MNPTPRADLDVRDGLATVTVANPGRRNAITAALGRQLASICHQIDTDRSIGAVIVRGADGFFCSGGDRDELAAVCADPASAANMAAISDVYSAFLSVAELEPPVVAAVRGAAVGAGMNLALACDVRVVAEDATLASGFTQLGVHPGGGHLGMLAASGRQTATVLGVLGGSLTGAQAVHAGLAWTAVPDERVEQTAAELVASAAADPELSRRTKESLRLQLPDTARGAGAAIERAPQLWSFARKGAEGWRDGERAVARGQHPG